MPVGKSSPKPDLPKPTMYKVSVRDSSGSIHKDIEAYKITIDGDHVILHGDGLPKVFFQPIRVI
jgi:hypothetical protein